MRVETAQREHFDDWLRLREAVYTGIDLDFHEREIELYCQNETKQCFLAFVGSGRACAMLEVSLRNVVDGCLTSPVGYIEGIFVDPDERGKGVARQLLQTAESWCRSKGCEEIATDAELDNVDAQQFHQRMGFEETYRIVEFRKSL